MARAVAAAGPWPVQLRYETGLTSDEYVSRQAWRKASLPRCPNHPWGGCSLARHGTYRRKTPAGTQIARWYCAESHTTFSLLPDCLAARLPGTLDELESIVAAAEQAPSLEAAANVLRLDIELPGPCGGCDAGWHGCTGAWSWSSACCRPDDPPVPLHRPTG